MGKYYSRAGKKATDYGLQKIKSNRLELVWSGKMHSIRLLEKLKTARNSRGDRNIVTGKLFRMDKSLGKV